MLIGLVHGPRGAAAHELRVPCGLRVSKAQGQAVAHMVARGVPAAWRRAAAVYPVHSFRGAENQWVHEASRCMNPARAERPLLLTALKGVAAAEARPAGAWASGTMKYWALQDASTVCVRLLIPTAAGCV